MSITGGILSSLDGGELLSQGGGRGLLVNGISQACAPYLAK